MGGSNTVKIYKKDYALFCDKWSDRLNDKFPNGLTLSNNNIEWIKNNVGSFEICFACYRLLKGKFGKYRQANYFYDRVSFFIEKEQAINMLKYVLKNKSLPRTALKGLPEED